MDDQKPTRFLAVVERGYDEPRLFWKLKSQNIGEAVEEFRILMVGELIHTDNYIGYEGGQIELDREYDLKIIERATIYEVKSENDVIVDLWADRAKENVRNAKATASKKAEKKEYERLKDKFG